MQPVATLPELFLTQPEHLNPLIQTWKKKVLLFDLHPSSLGALPIEDSSMLTTAASRFGLYIHIPFCSRLCHYCDFVKTARFEADGPEKYLQAIDRLVEAWLDSSAGLPPLFDSVFFGGGTPSLLDHAYQPLLDRLKPWLRKGAEITLEANPEHISPEKLEVWARLGFNRLSLGVQSFQSEGLRFLTREHSSEQALTAIEQALEFFQNVNVDLIYGWGGQDLSTWQRDLDTALALDIRHLSLYTLTYEGQTPLARRQRRGILRATEDELLEAMYLAACQSLRTQGWDHEEVSNWHRPGFASVHNSIYWHAGSYLGLGNGAHSFLEAYGGAWGTRWAQDASQRLLYSGLSDLKPGMAISDFLNLPGVNVDKDRKKSEWLLELVSSGLRTQKGINLNAICMKTGYSFKPTPLIERALSESLMQLSQNGILTLREEEWYRETGWALQASLSFIGS